MRIIAVANQKGGVGKTTTTVNLAANLAARGRDVVLVDLDPQAHLTTFLGAEPSQSSYGVLTRSKPVAEALIPVRERMKLLGSGLDLAAAEQELVSMVGRETILRDALAAYEADCDYVFIDCPPSLGLLTLNALGAAEEVFITLQPHFLSLQGLSQLLETVLLVHKRINPKLVVSGLLFCIYDARTALSQEIVRDVTAFFDRQEEESPWRDVRIFDTRIRRNVKLAESPSYGRTILEYDLKCHGAEDYAALADEVEAMVGADEPMSAADVAPGGEGGSEIAQVDAVAEGVVGEEATVAAGEAGGAAADTEAMAGRGGEAGPGSGADVAGPEAGLGGRTIVEGSSPQG